jgi:hypothetical protein
MMALDNRTSYAVAANWIRDKQGVHHWLVAVRATFDIDRAGSLKLADEQPPPILAPEHRGEPAATSLRVDSDLLALKPTTDVLLDASAHAPKAKATATVPVTLRIGPLEKTLLVHGTRVYYRGIVGLTTSAPRPFTTRPLHYELAYGGTDTSHADPRKHRIDARNPVGKGFSVDAARLEGQEAHAIEYPSGDPAKLGPAGFGPIDRSWAPRRELAGTYDASWEQKKRPLLPDDYDERFALGAPGDQRLPGYLRGGEQLDLVNMTPDGALRFRLPKLALQFATFFGHRREDHGGNLATVLVEPDKMRIALTWQTALLVRARQTEKLDKTTITEPAA